CSGLPRLPVTEEIAGSNPVGLVYGAVAQLVEQRIEAPCVGSSTLSCATDFQYMKRGGIAKWPNATGCKSGLFRVRSFKSFYVHISGIVYCQHYGRQNRHCAFN